MKCFLVLLALFSYVPAYADVSVPRSKQYLWNLFDVASQGGASVSHAQGVSVPAGAIITGVYVYINTQFAATGTESIGISCLGSQNIMAYNSVKNVLADRMFAGSLSNTAFTGAAAPIGQGATTDNLSQGFVSVPSACGLTVDVRGNSGDTPYTAGKATIILEYFRL